jgi:DNA-binding HxlR family transcriptional regulator
MRFSEIGQSVPELSDRLLSERMKELEARGIVQRTVIPGPPVRVEYNLSTMGRDLEPALTELHRWANRWLEERAPAGHGTRVSGTDSSALVEPGATGDALGVPPVPAGR